MYESESVMTQGEIRTQVYTLPQLYDCVVVPCAEPKRSSHRPVRRRIVFVDDQAPSRGLHGKYRVLFAIAPLLESALPMCEGKARMGASEGRIEPHGHLKKSTGRLVFRFCEAVHMPKAAVIGLPGIK